MRRALLACLLLGLADAAIAQDFDRPVLRGTDVIIPEPPALFRWDGLYVGGQVGHGTANVDFGGGAASLVQHILRDTIIEQEGRVSEWTALGNRVTNGRSYGVFLGYNHQMDDLVLGVELNYNRSSLNAQVGDAIGRSFQTSDGYFYSTNVAAASNYRLTDYGTLRARFGYVMGRFMPFAMVSAAAGRAEVYRTATVTTSAVDVSGQGRPDLYLAPTTRSETTSNYMFGFGAGAGVDVAIAPGFFLRGEYEFVQFTKASDVIANVNAVRVGGAVKF